MLQIHPLNEQLSVAPQIDATDIAVLAAQGFRSIINNRPDGEEPGQPGNAALDAAARQAGLEWRYIPIAGMPGQAQMQAFANALRELPPPVLAFCRSGNRSSMLWALQAEGTADSIVETARAAGYDLSQLRPWLGRATRS